MRCKAHSCYCKASSFVFLNYFKDCPQFPGDSCRAAPGQHQPGHTRNFCQSGPSSTGCAERDRQLGRSLCKHSGAEQHKPVLLPRQEGVLAINQVFYPKVSHFQLLLSPPARPFPWLSCSSANEPQLPQLRLPITQVSYKSVKRPQLQQGWHHVPVLLLILRSSFAIFSTSPDAPHQRYSNKYKFAGCREHLSKLPTCWTGWGKHTPSAFRSPQVSCSFPFLSLPKLPSANTTYQSGPVCLRCSFIKFHEKPRNQLRPEHVWCPQLRHDAQPRATRAIKASFKL